MKTTTTRRTPEKEVAKQGLDRERIERESLIARYTSDDVVKAWVHGFMTGRGEEEE